MHLQRKFIEFRVTSNVFFVQSAYFSHKKSTTVVHFCRNTVTSSSLSLDGGVCSQSSVTIVTQAGTAPGAVTDFRVVQNSLSTFGATVTWTVASSAGDPPEDYFIKCWYNDEEGRAANCNTATPIYTFGPFPRYGGTKQTTLTGMVPVASGYTCTLGARNDAVVKDVCSNRISVDIPSLAPGKPATVSDTVSGTTWVANWDDGTAGIPEETYTAKCVPLNYPCFATAVGTTRTNIARGVKAANVANLPSGASYSCYIVAANFGGSICSDPVTVVVSP